MKQKESTRLSDYQRIVSYLYEYHHGIKGSNVGFAKIEKRQNRLRVYFHVKTNDQALEYKIYFYYFHQGTMNGIYLDTVKRTDTIIEFKNTYPLINDFDKIDGFLLYYSNDHFFGSQWKDHPIIIRSFVPVDPDGNKNDKISSNILENESEKTKLKSSEDTKETENIKKIEKTEKIKDSEKAVSPPPEPSPKTETPPTSSLSEYIEALQLEKDAKQSTHPNPTKDFDWKEYPTLPMPPSYGLDPSIKIGLDDLDEIPDLSGNVKTNG